MKENFLSKLKLINIKILLKDSMKYFVEFYKFVVQIILHFYLLMLKLKILLENSVQLKQSTE